MFYRKSRKEQKEQLDTYLYIILDLNIFFWTILCIFFSRNILSYKMLFLERHDE